VIPMIVQLIDVTQPRSSTVGRLTIDSKAMRRMKPNEVTALLVSNKDHTGAADIDFLAGGRILFAN